MIYNVITLFLLINYNFIDCWQYEAKHRPNIHEVVDRLEKIIEITNYFRSYDSNTNVQNSISSSADFYSCNSNRSNQRLISSSSNDFYSCSSSRSNQRPINSFRIGPISSFTSDFYSRSSSISNQRPINSSRINSVDENIEQLIRNINNNL